MSDSRWASAKSGALVRGIIGFAVSSFVEVTVTLWQHGSDEAVKKCELMKKFVHDNACQWMSNDCQSFAFCKEGSVWNESDVKKTISEYANSKLGSHLAVTIPIIVVGGTVLSAIWGGCKGYFGDQCGQVTEEDHVARPIRIARRPRTITSDYVQLEDLEQGRRTVSIATQTGDLKTEAQESKTVVSKTNTQLLTDRGQGLGLWQTRESESKQEVPKSEQRAGLVV